MNKTPAILLAALIAAISLGACGSPADKPGDGKMSVVASFYPMYDFAQKAAGGLAEVSCLVPDGAEPHEWEPTPQDIVALESAGLFVYSGAGFEGWVPDIIPQVKNKNLKSLDASEGIEELFNADNISDPHIWLSPQNAKQQFLNICAALEEADPENADGYRQNRNKWAAEFDALIAEYAQLEELPKRLIVTTHEAFGYLCAECGLTQLSPAGYSPDAEPDPASMAKIVAQARDSGVTTVFYEELTSSATAEAIAREIGAKTAPLSPIEGLSSEQRERGDDYFSVMRQNLSALNEALA